MSNAFSQPSPVRFGPAPFSRWPRVQPSSSLKYPRRRLHLRPSMSISHSSRTGRRKSRSRRARKIVWTNHDQTPHTVTSNDRSFASKGLDTDDKYEHTFASEGDFSYICTVHPFMTGVVHVRKP